MRLKVEAMIKPTSQPSERELPFHGLSLNATLKLESPPVFDCARLKSALSDKANYSQFKDALFTLTDSHIERVFGRPRWRKCSFGPPHVIWDNDEDEFVLAELTPLVLLGIELDVRMKDPCYDALVDMIQSDDFCEACEAIVTKQMRHLLNALDISTAVNIETEVTEFGGG